MVVHNEYFSPSGSQQKLRWHLDLAATNPDELMIATIYAAQGVMDYLIDCFDGALQMPKMDSDIEMHLL